MAYPVNQYREDSDAKRTLQIRAIIRELPQACSDFIRSIAVTTSTLTRLAYAIDLRTFFHFLQTERIPFSEKKLTLLTDQDLGLLTQNDLTAYTEYLTYYFKNTDNDSVPNKIYVNHELSIKRKLCTIRSFYDYLFKNQRISSNVTELVPLPKVHEKPIIRLNKEEMVRMLDQAQSGDQLTKQQQKFQKITARRDYAILSLFLGTGIRVSECIGMNLGDVDLENNAFIVTRKGGNQVVLYFPPEVAEALAEFKEKYPRKKKWIDKKIAKFSQANTFREDLRSKGVWIFSVFRDYLRMIGKVNGLGDDIFMLTIDEANEVNFGEMVLSSRVPVWVIFGARWSTPCQTLISTLSEVQTLLGDLAKLVKVNADESIGLGIWYCVDSLPTLLYFKKGLVCARIVGMSDKENLLAKMRRIMDGEFDGEGA